MTKTDGISSQIAGSNSVYTYLVTISNIGVCSAEGVTATDTWPSDFLQGTINTSKGNVTSSPDFVWNVGTIEAGKSATLTVNYTVPSDTPAGTYTNTITASTVTSEYNYSNNEGVDVNSVNVTADLAVVKTGPATITAGNTITYSVAVRNLGPSDATGVTVTDTIPSGLTGDRKSVV